MKSDELIKELISALSQTTPLPEPEEIPEKTEEEIIVGDASPAVQALVLLSIRLEKSREGLEGQDRVDIEDAAAVVGHLAMNLAALDQDYRDLEASGFVKGWKLAHDPNDFVIIMQ